MPVHIRLLRASKWNVMLLKILVVWENMFKSDLLDTLHIPAYCSGFSSSCKEKSSEMFLCAPFLHLWESLPIVKTAILGVIYIPDSSGQQTRVSQKHFKLLFGEENKVLRWKDSLPSYHCSLMDKTGTFGRRNTEVPVTGRCCTADKRTRTPV